MLAVLDGAVSSFLGSVNVPARFALCVTRTSTPRVLVRRSSIGLRRLGTVLTHTALLGPLSSEMLLNSPIPALLRQPRTLAYIVVTITVNTFDVRRRGLIFLLLTGTTITRPLPRSRPRSFRLRSFLGPGYFRFFRLSFFPFRLLYHLLCLCVRLQATTPYPGPFLGQVTF